MAEIVGQTAKAAPPLHQRIGTFLGEVRTEMAKVVWPTRAQLNTYTRVVIATTAIMAVAMGIFDGILSRGLQKFFEWTTG